MIALYGHPFSSFTWKVLIALYERDVPFEFRVIDGNPQHQADIAHLSPTGQFPALVHGDAAITGSNAVIEYLDLHCGSAAPMVPADPRVALAARELASVFDDYVSKVMQVPVSDALRPADRRDPFGVEQARALLDRSYAWLDARLAGRPWATGETFGLADCAAAPALFYADWVQPIPASHATLRAYRARLLARPSVARVVDEARPYRHFFPLGAPDRD